MLLEGPVDRDRLAVTLQRRLVDLYPVFRQVPVASRVPGRLPHWEDDPDFDLARHIRTATLPAPGDQRALQDYVNAHLATPLDRSRPLWEVHLVDGYGDGAAVYTRLHHCLADGIALMRVLLSLTDDAPEGDLAEEPTPEAERPGVVGTALHLAELTGAVLLDVPRLLNPLHAVETLTLARQTAGVAAKLLLTQNPTSPVNGPIGLEKRVVWAEPFPLEDIVETAHRTGTTVNDVPVAALAGALAAYQERRGVEPVDIPTMVPVNVRPLDQPLPRELGNRFALVLFTLPSGQFTTFGRLAETKRRMDSIKHSPEPLLTFGMIQGIGLTGPHIERVLVDFFANKASGVTTNVPGPPGPRYVAGSRITAVLGWPPESGRETLGTSIFSYDGQVQVGFRVDASVIPDPEELLRDYLDEVAALTQLAAVH
jgi:WS/DGAT/MGAT family acyltransferase